MLCDEPEDHAVRGDSTHCENVVPPVGDDGGPSGVGGGGGAADAASGCGALFGLLQPVSER